MSRIAVLPRAVADQIAAGEVVRVLDRQEAWARVEVDGEREGGVEAARLISLAAD